MIATLCRKHGEAYDQEVARVRSERFGNLSMTIAWNVFMRMNEAIEFIDEHYKWIFGGTGEDRKMQSVFKRSGLDRFGCNAWLYEVAQSGIERLEVVKRMRLYEFINILSYLRCNDKLKLYAAEKRD
jgi:hypothetical protein